MVVQVLSVFLFLGIPLAGATDLERTPEPMPEELALLKERESREDRQEEIDEAAAEEERKRKSLLARVIVIRWENTSTDYTDDNVQRNVRSRITRPEALFFPEVDLYQNGRKVPDTTVIPANQPAIVPDNAGPTLLGAVEEIASVPQSAMDVSGWAQKAQDLLDLSDRVWFVDRVELREPLFLLYAQIGRVADNQDFPAPPYYEQVGPLAVNYYYYLAAQLAYQEPALLAKLTDQDQIDAVGYLFDQIRNGFFAPLKLDFTQDTAFSLEAFQEEYTVLLNGLPVDLDPRGQIDVFPGITDVYLLRNDTGHGLSERFESIKLEEKIYSVRDVARKKVGVTFKDQLFLYKRECSPEVDGDILNYLAIYQKLHSSAEVYVAVPENGNPNKVWIWRYDPGSAQLYQVGGGPDAFPVRFATLVSTGVLYNGASISVDDAGSSLLPTDIIGSDPVSSELHSATIPFDFELRLHYNRIMVNMGLEAGYSASSDSDGWVEYFQTPGLNKTEDWSNNEEVWTYDLDDCQQVDSDGDGDLDAIQCDEELVSALNMRTFNRHLYIGAGALLGRDAGIGFGPRIAAQFGWVNMPHSFQPTLHLGWAIQPPIGEFAGRVRPIVDLDLRGGASISRARSLQLDLVHAAGLDLAEPDEKLIMPVFGLNLGAGFTF
jgi:hypothetical protein